MAGARAKLPQYHTLFTTVLILIMFLYPSESAVYIVGEDEKWSTGVNYLTWSKTYNFSVGDILVFEYLKGAHNVYDVTKQAYHTCNETDGVYVKYQSGNDTIELKKPKKYWYICNIPGHCFAGMRLTIDVYAASSLTSPSPLISLHPPPPDINHSNSNKHGTLTFTMFFKFLVLLTLFT